MPKPCANCGHNKGTHRIEYDGICVIRVYNRFGFGEECGCNKYQEREEQAHA